MAFGQYSRMIAEKRFSLDVNEAIREVLALTDSELYDFGILVDTELTSGLRSVRRSDATLTGYREPH